jgi:ketosteroid isomerase-like protein
MSTRTIEQLSDIEDIKQLKARYCRLIDQKNWTELEAQFAADAHIEINGAPGGAEDTQKFTSAQQFIEALRRLMGPLTSVHQVHAPEIELRDAGNARGTWTICDRLVFPDGIPLKVLQGWGLYHETYRKISGQWHIASVRLERLLVEPIHDETATDAKSVASKLLECIGAHDLASMKELFAEEIEWFVPGSSALPWTGRRTRGSQASEFFEVMWPHYVVGKSTADVDEVISDGKNVFITGTFSHVIKSSGNAFTTPVVLHLKVENGRIRYLQLYEDTLLIAQAYGIAEGAPAVDSAHGNTSTYKKMPVHRSEPAELTG